MINQMLWCVPGLVDEDLRPTGARIVQLLTQSPPNSGGPGPRAHAFVLIGCGVWLVCLVAACSSLSCRPLTVTVADKEERARLDMVPRGVWTTETGRLEELRSPEIVRDYWVRAEDGTWYRVSLDKFRAAEVGGPVEICR